MSEDKSINNSYLNYTTVIDILFEIKLNILLYLIIYIFI
jgi:hypothetical protein